MMVLVMVVVMLVMVEVVVEVVKLVDLSCCLRRSQQVETVRF